MIHDKIWEFKCQYRFLSNFWPCRIWHSGICFPSVEHAFQACKVSDVGYSCCWHNKRVEISRLPTPGYAKRIGATLVLRPDWEQVKLRIMLVLLRKKFQIPELRSKLLSTGFRNQLIEGNWWGDSYWGYDFNLETGQNHLGKILMQVREEIRNARTIIVS